MAFEELKDIGHHKWPVPKVLRRITNELVTLTKYWFDRWWSSVMGPPAGAHETSSTCTIDTTGRESMMPVSVSLMRCSQELWQTDSEAVRSWTPDPSSPFYRRLDCHTVNTGNLLHFLSLAVPSILPFSLNTRVLRCSGPPVP